MIADRELEKRVGFWPRVGAYVLDLSAVWAIGLIAHRPVAALFPGAVAAVIQEATVRAEAEPMRPFLEWAARLGVTITLLAPFYALFEALRGWSPGKLVLGLRIATDTGHKAPPSALLARWGIKGAAGLIALVAMLTSVKSLNVLAQATAWATAVGCLLVLTKSRLALHDRIAGTAVLRKADVVGVPTGRGAGIGSEGASKTAPNP